MYMRGGKELPDGLEDELDEHLRLLEQTTGKRFGDPEDPLLVSVRSGAAVSMPGMMDTILNLGLNDEAVEGLARTTGNPRFAYDAYRRLVQMYGEVVDDVEARQFEDALDELKRNARSRPGRRPRRGRPEGARRPVPDDLRRGQRATGSPRTRASSSSARCGPSSTPGRRLAPRSTAARTGSPTTSARP